MFSADEEELKNDPNYRFGVIMGRMQAVTEVMGMFAHEPAAADDLPGQLRDMVLRQERIASWMEQSKAECELEGEMLQMELAAAERAVSSD